MAAWIELAYRDPLTAFAPFKDAPLAMLLHGRGGWSYALAPPQETMATQAPDGPGIVDALRRWSARGEPGPAPFSGGAGGFLAYEGAAAFDAAAPRPRPSEAPVAVLGLYRRLVAFDHASRRAFAIAESRREADRLAARLGAGDHPPAPASGWIEALDSAAWYGAQVAALKARIRAGDLFQANLSRRFAGALGADDHPYDLFARLTRDSPAPFGAYLRLEDAAIVSNSPERLASVRRRGADLIARTAPIKGTRPRGANAVEDEARAAELAASEKDRAENLMIVDLMRNDFARVCAPGGVRVPALFEIETYANVHHLVSRVEGRLAPGADAADLLAATFPAGSITGAPKLKAMELIQNFERGPRGANYGALFWMGADGAMEASVLIRTATCVRTEEGWDAAFRAGGGITIGSDPDDEARETDDKARALIAAIVGGP